MRAAQCLMPGLGRSSRACATLVAAWACGAIAIQGCGVLVSSDCAQKAVCMEDAGAMSDVTRPPTMDTGFTSPEAQSDVAKEQGTEVVPDAARDTGAREAATDGPLDSGVDSGPDAAVDTGVDATMDVSTDTGQDTGQDTGGGQGPRCLASDGSFFFCSANEHCCVNGPTHVASCATSCDADAGLYAVDCPGATGAGGCGSQICCGTIAFSGGVVPNCIASQLTSSCADTCASSPGYPGGAGQCLGRSTIRYCTAAADCANEPNGNTSCCNFGTQNPLNWCVPPAAIDWNSCLQ